MLKLEKNLFFEQVEASGLDSSLFAADDVQPGRLGDARYSSGLEIRFLGADFKPKFDFRALLIDFGLAVATALLLSKENGTALFQFIADVMISAGRLLSGL